MSSFSSSSLLPVQEMFILSVWQLLSSGLWIVHSQFFSDFYFVMAYNYEAFFLKSS